MAYVEAILSDTRPQTNKQLVSDFALLTRYYYAKEKKPKQIISLLDEYAKKADKSYTADKWTSFFDELAHSNAKKVKLTEIDYIRVTKSEIEKIKMLDKRMAQKLAFTLLCLSKYRNEVSESSNSWENYKLTEVLAMANLTLKAESKDKLISELVDAGYIELPKKLGNSSIRVTFVDDKSPTALRVTDFRCLGYTYLQYLGEKYNVCAVCGKLIPRDKNNRRKYCTECKNKYYDERVRSYYVPTGKIPILVNCSRCGKKIAINPTENWLDSLCDSCKVADM